MNQLNLTPTVRQLLFINIAVFVFTDLIVPAFHAQLGLPEETKEMYFALMPLNSGYFIPSQVLTYMFTHDNFPHLLFNMFGLITFGPPLEYMLRRQRFLLIYFAAGLGALALQWYIAPDTALVGASGCIFGLLAAFALYFPNVELMMMFIPVPIKAKYFVLFYAAAELYLGLSGRQSGVAHFAHLGGAITAFLIILYWRKGRVF
jgi:membrane associated rhomboid family serine protease